MRYKWNIPSIPEYLAMDTAQLAAVADNRRVRRSFAFIDLCGFTDFLDARGDEDAVAELQHLRNSVREVAPLFGVRVEKWLGDGCMLVGVDNEPIVAAVVAIHQRHRRHGELPLRAGIATGPVLLLEGDDYVGRAVNLASRLSDEAGPHEILASSEELHLPTWVQVTAETTISVKGLTEPLKVVALAAEPTSRDAHGAAGAIVSFVDGITRPVRSLRSARAHED
jgi:adenylate cyclase